MWSNSNGDVALGLRHYTMDEKKNENRSKVNGIPELETVPCTPYVKTVNNPFQSPFEFARFRYDGREDNTAVDEDEEGSRHPQQTQAEHGRTT